MNYYRTDELYHHGILGQRWGKRNGPPYPLDAADHSTSEKKAGWRKSLLSNDVNAQTHKKYDFSKIKDFKIKQKVFSGIAIDGTQTEDDVKRNILSKNKNAAVVNPDNQNWFKKNKKEIIVGTGIVLSVAAIAVGTKVYSDYQDRALEELFNRANKPAINSGKAFINQKLSDNGGFAGKPQRFIGGWLYCDAHRFDPISKEEFANMTNDDSIVINVGSKMYRMMDQRYDSLRSGFEYVSIDEDDRLRYKGFLPQMWNGSKSGDGLREVFEQELSAKNTIKAPGKKESIEIMEAALKKAYPGRTDSVYREDILKNFYLYCLNLGDRDNKLGAAYADELYSRGYNATIDFNDQGRLANRPLILLNGDMIADVKKVNRYSIGECRKEFKNIDLPDKIEDFSIEKWKELPQEIRYLAVRKAGVYFKGI